MLKALLGDVRAAENWVENGGGTTLESYHVPADAGPTRWAESVPLAHIQWMRTRELTHIEGGYLFVHAGIRPGRKLYRQNPADLQWIREPFLSSKEAHSFVVVHGHTPSGTPEILPNRIGIDTGAAMGGMLTCLVLQENRLRFLTA